MTPKRTLFQLAKTLGGLPVLGCLMGGPAASAGVRYGDVLLSVNGQKTRSFADYVEAKALRQDGMRVTIFRDGREVDLELAFDPHKAAMDPQAIIAEIVAMRALAGDGEDREDPGGGSSS